MSEWLTTGQMIDRLKVGQVAEGMTYWEVKKIVNGCGYDSIVEVNSGEQVKMSESFLEEKWRILPNYVSFEEAMKAFKQDEEICLWLGDKDFKFATKYHHTLNDLNLSDLIHGKWTIEE